MHHYDAELHDVRWSRTYSGALDGIIKNDSKRRFNDGTFIHTSTVVELTAGYVQTKNTVYKIMNWKGQDNEHSSN